MKLQWISLILTRVVGEPLRVKVGCDSSRQLKTRFGLCESGLAMERDYNNACGVGRSALGYMVKHLSASGGCLGS
jgi:hypothetical protein